MTDNNHPAHDPVSLDRLHQIRETLSKAAAQSDGGNLGYAMADAVKVIDGAIAAFGVESARCPKCNDTGMTDSGGVQPRGEPILIECDCRVDMLQANYRDLSQPVDPQVAEYEEMMNQSGNYPVTPDGWIPVSERMPDKLIPVMVMYEDGEMWSAMWNGNSWDDGTEYPDPHEVTHWRGMPAAPQQEE